MKASLTLSKEIDEIDVFYEDKVISIKAHHDAENGEIRMGIDAPTGSKIHWASETTILPKLVF